MINKEVQDLLKILSNILIPPKGKLDVTFSYCNELFTVPCPTFYGFSDVPYTLPFFYFNHEIIVEIFVAIITEQQVVFIGNSKTTNILLMECFLCYIFPMEWIAPYLPILPEKLYDMFGALGYFIFGSNRSALEEIEPEGNIIVVDVDHGTVTYSDKSIRYRVDDFVIARLKERLPKSAFSFFSTSNEHIFESREALEREKNDFDIKLNAQVFIAMQYLMFDIYEGLLTFQMSAKKQLSLKGGQRTKEHVSESLNPLQYHLKDSMMRSNLRIKFNNPYLERQFFSTLDLLKSQPIHKVLNKFMATKRSNETIEFTSYASGNLTNIEKRLAVCRDPSVKSSLLYLKSLLLLQLDKPVKAFQSLNKIFEAGIEDFPAAETIYLLQKLEYNLEVYNEILSQPFMKQPVWIPLTTDLGHTNTILNISSQATYSHLEVPDLLTQLGMTRNHNIARKIFDVLKSSRVVIGHDIKNFCGIWKSFKKTLDCRHVPVVPNRREKIVKISSQAEVTGTGLYIVCTILRLYMVNYITDQAAVSIELTDIVDLSIKNNGIVFKLSSGEQQVAENVRNLSDWFVILEELIGATSEYKKTKDYNNLMDARANILIYESLNQYEKQYGELINTDECHEPLNSSFYYKGKVKNSEFLLFREEFLNYRSVSRSVSTSSTGHGPENVLCRFSPNPRVKETIYTVITHKGSIFVGTKNCNIYRISEETREVEDHISLMFTNTPSQWTLYSFTLIKEALWVPLKYSSLSLYIISTTDLHRYQTLSLPHQDHIAGVVYDGGSLCYITSIDGATSLWCAETRTLLRCIRSVGYGLMSCCLVGAALIQSGKDTLFKFDGNNFVPHQTECTLTKITSSASLLFGIDKRTPQVIRCYSPDLVHLEDIWNTAEEPVSGFINLCPYNDTHLIITTKNKSLLVYSLAQHCFTMNISNAHSDLISAITVTEEGVLVTGSKSADGNICLWAHMFH